MLTLLKSFFVVSGRKWNCFQTANISQSFHAPAIFVIGFLLVFAKCSDEQIKVQTQGERQSLFLDFTSCVFHSMIQSDLKSMSPRTDAHTESLSPSYLYRVILFYKLATPHAGSQLTGFGCWLMFGDRVQSERGEVETAPCYLPHPLLGDAALPRGWLNEMCVCTQARTALQLGVFA